MVSFDPNRPDFAPYGFTCVRWSPTEMRRPDRHNEIELNFLDSGWVTYLLGGRKVRVEAGQLSAFWAAIPHQILDHGDEPEYFVATLPLAWFLQCQLPQQLVQPLLQGQMICEPAPRRPRTDADLFSGWEKDLRAKDPGVSKAVLLEMEARLLRLALSCPALATTRPSTRKRRSTLSDAGLTKVEQMAAMIAQRYTERLTVELIARSVGLHPNYAMNLFQKAFGTTLIDYVTQHRVSHAQRLLVSSDLKIIDVAIASGFGSLSRFNDAFRRSCGCSPREYKRHHQISA
jgi:AraC family transcriptional regulator, melibiose operon regulatory protein